MHKLKKDSVTAGINNSTSQISPKNLTFISLVCGKKGEELEKVLIRVLFI